MTTERGSQPSGPLTTFLSRPHRRVILDVGCGDARATARLAAGDPEALVIGVDANLDAADRVLRRARRAPEKGGLPNLLLVRAAADRLPQELSDLVDELRIDLPWGSLLDGLLGADGALLAGLTRVLAPGGHLRIVANAGSLAADPDAHEAGAARLGRSLETAGLTDVRVESTAVAPETGWGKRLAGGRPLPVIVAEARRPPT